MNSGRGGDRDESPQAIFDRISRRRAVSHAAASGSAPAVNPRALHIDELVDVGPDSAGLAPVPEETAMADTFPRSATIRTLLRHPALAVGVGVPTAVLLLRTAAARRLLQTGLVLGARPEVRAALAAALAAATNVIQDRRHRADQTALGAGDRSAGPAGERDQPASVRGVPPTR